MSTLSHLLAEAEACYTAGDLQHAAKLYESILSQNPEETTALANLAVVAMAQGHYPRAVELASSALEINADLSEAWNTRGIALAKLNRLEEAVESYDLALQLRTDFAEAYLNRAGALLYLGLHDEALADSHRAVALSPALAAAHCVLGSVLRDFRHYDAALASYDRAIALAPNLVDAHNGRIVLLMRLGRVAEAMAASDGALPYADGHAEFYNNRGTVLAAMRRYEDARHCYDKAIGFQPGYGDALWNKSLLLLLLGRYEEGWPLYEWRWHSRALVHTVRPSMAPQWAGEDLGGKTVLLFAEQGFGDAIQFARYAPLVAERAAKVILEAPPPLARLLARMDPRIVVVARGDQPIAPYDFHCALLSLPAIFKTTLSSVPASIPYLSADTDYVERWRQRLGSQQRPRVGLTWAGSAEHPNDINRSMAVETLAPLLGVDCEFHSLQRDIAPRDRAWMESQGDIQWHGDKLETFEDSAALAHLMDMIVTVDTATAHLAGALGKPACVLIPYAPDFRWLTDRADSPWYPTVRIFRQAAMRDWSVPLKEVKAQLEELTQR